MEKLCRWLFHLGLIGIAVSIPMISFCSVESSLGSVQSKLNSLLPVLATLGIGFAAISFFIGSPNAKGHLIMAIIGAVIGFGAPSIISLLRSTIH